MAQRGRPRKNASKETKKEQDNKTSQDFSFEEFAKGATMETPYLSSLLGSNYMQNPYWMNTILKTSEGLPTKYKRDEIVEALNDPIANEQKLRNMHLQFYHTNLFYKRIIKYFSTMMLWTYYIKPEGVTKQDIASNIWRTKYDKVLSWIRKFDMQYELQLITEYLVGEDTGFFYLRESSEGNNFMKMPQDYCKIVRKHGLYYEYAFNFMYFLRPNSMDVDDFDPWFREKFDELFSGKTSQDIHSMGAYLWEELPYEKAPCFKFNQITAAIIPTFVGAYLDILSIIEYKDLIKTKTSLDCVQLLTQKIPLKDSKDASTGKSPLLIDGTTAGKYHRAVKEDLPQGVRIVTTPMEVKSINFDKSDNKDSIVGFAETSFYKNIGTDAQLFSSDNSTAASLAKSIMTDETFVMSIQKPIQYFLNIRIKQISGKYDIKIIFPPLTYYNCDSKVDVYLKCAQYGVAGSKSLLLCSMGLNAPDSAEMGAYEDIILDCSNWIPLQSSHTMSDNPAGRPTSNEMTDAKENSIEHNSNIERGTGVSY